MGPLFFSLLICIALAFSPASSQTQCKENYQEFEGSCYSLSDREETWYSSKQRCESHGGRLVSIESEEENKFVQRLSQNTAVWIGGYMKKDVTSESLKWRWVNGQQTNYTNWDRGQPRDFQRKAVAMMFADGTWGNEYYSEHFKFICEEEATPVCEEGYLLIDSDCFIYREDKLGFQEAQKNCSGDGGNLASIHSDDLEESLRSLAESDLAWIGGYKDPQNAAWQWTDKTSFDYENWATSQPAPNPNNICLLFNYPDDQKGSWSNELCHIAYGYICEKPMNKKP